MQPFLKGYVFGSVFALSFFSARCSFAWTMPVDSGYVVTNGFWNCGVACYHLGDDIVAPEGTEIRSIGEGIVKEVTYNAGRGNYGGRVLIEYSFYDYSIGRLRTIVALFGHLGQDTDDEETDDIFVAVGNRVREGQVIGRIGSSSENGGWPPHLHLGISRGAYAGGATECNRWIYAGYTARRYEPSDACYCAVMSNWYDPSEFLGVSSRDLRIISSSVSPETGYVNDTEFVWHLAADGGRGAPITASVITRRSDVPADLINIMSYINGTARPFEFEYPGEVTSAGVYMYHFRISTCYDSVEETTWHIGPFTSWYEEPYCTHTDEICDRIDNDCDGAMDEGITRSCINECGNSGTQRCDPNGTWDPNGGAWTSCSATACPPPCLPSAEICDNADNDCDDAIDEALVQNCLNYCGNSGSAYCTGGSWSMCIAPDCVSEEQEDNPPADDPQDDLVAGDTPNDPDPPDDQPDDPPITQQEPPAVPTISSPTNGFVAQTSPGVSRSVTLAWNSVPSAARYEYQIRFGGFSESGSLVTQTETTSTSYTFVTAAMNYGVEFQWKVRAIAINGTTSDWSLTRTFFFSYTIGAILRCTSSSCPYPDAWYRISSDIYDTGIPGVPPLLIADWISASCTAGRTAIGIPYAQMMGYQRSARYNGCPP